MLNYFIKNRHGVISVFCAIILIVMLSFSSLFLEIGRKRSWDACFQLIVENSAFSTLGNYDTELYKRFGLLALNPNVDEKVFKKYVLTNLNHNLEDDGIATKLLDNPLEVKNVTVDKMYDLSNTDILRNQIEEVSKYRAPVRQVTEADFFQDNITNVIKNVQKSYPAVSFLLSISEIGKGIVDICDLGQKVHEQSDAYITANDNYKDAVDTYNSAVDTYNNTINSLDTSDPDYETKKNNAESAMSSAASSMNSMISDLHTSVRKWQDGTTKLKDSVAKLVGNGAGAIIQGKISAERVKLKNASGEYALWTQQDKADYDKYLEQMDSANSATNTDDFLASCKSMCDKLLQLPFDGFCERLMNQKEEVNSYNKISVEEFQGNWLKEIFTAVTIATSAIQVLQQITHVLKELKKIFDIIGVVFEALDILSTLSMGANVMYNDNITSVTSTLPSYQKDANFMDPRKDYMDIVDSDKDNVDSILAESSQVAADLGYNLDTITPRVDNTQSEFEEASHKLITAQENFSNKTVYFGLIAVPLVNIIVIVQLVEWIIAFIDYLTCLVNYLKAFVEWVSVDNILSSIYSHLILSNYAVNMFPNRNTNTYSTKQKDLLRNTFSETSKFWSSTDPSDCMNVETDNFSVCRAEYVYAGKTSDIENQQAVYNAILKWRVLNNTILLFTNDLFRSLNESLTSLPILGWIILIIFDVVVVLVECLLDMFLLCCADSQFKVVKTDMWLWSYDGLKEFCEQLEKYVKLETSKENIRTYFANVTQSSSLIEASDDGTTIDDSKLSATDLIPKWGYKDYLQFLITFKNSDYVVTRIGDLIQLEMNARYQRKGLGNYDINKAYTYIRVSAEAEYKPILPALSIPNFNDKIFTKKIDYYCGY